MREAATVRDPAQETRRDAMKIALFCLEASRDDFGRLRLRFALCVVMTQKVASETLPAAV